MGDSDKITMFLSKDLTSFETVVYMRPFGGVRQYAPSKWYFTCRKKNMKHYKGGFSNKDQALGYQMTWARLDPYNRFGLMYVEVDGNVLFRFSNGGKGIISVVDRHLLTDYSWSLNTGGYLCGRMKSSLKSMHRVILSSAQVPPSPLHTDCDHINGVKTDNRRCNLRWTTVTENMYNQSKYKTNKSGRTGVYHDTRSFCFVTIGENSKRTYHRYDSNDVESARVAWKEAVNTRCIFERKNELMLSSHSDYLSSPTLDKAWWASLQPIIRHRMDLYNRRNRQKKRIRKRKTPPEKV